MHVARGRPQLLRVGDADAARRPRPTCAACPSAFSTTGIAELDRRPRPPPPRRPRPPRRRRTARRPPRADRASRSSRRRRSPGAAGNAGAPGGGRSARRSPPRHRRAPRSSRTPECRPRAGPRRPARCVHRLRDQRPAGVADRRGDRRGRRPTSAASNSSEYWRSRRSSPSSARRRPRPTRAATGPCCAKLLKSCSPPPARSTGLPVAAVARQRRRQPALQLARQQRQLEARVGGDVGRDRAVPAAVRQHGHPPAGHPRRRRAAPARRRSARAGVRTRCAPAARHAASTTRVSLTSAPVCDAAARVLAALRPTVSTSTGLPRRGAGVDERPAVAEVLGVDGDQLGPLVLRERRDQLGQVEVGLVAHRGKSREAEVVGRGAGCRARAPGCRSGEIRPIEPGGNSFDARPRSLRRVEHAEAVGAEQHRAGRAHPLDERPFAQRPPRRRPRRARP